MKVAEKNERTSISSTGWNGAWGVDEARTCRTTHKWEELAREQTKRKRWETQNRQHFSTASRSPNILCSCVNGIVSRGNFRGVFFPKKKMAHTSNTVSKKQNIWGEQATRQSADDELYVVLLYTCAYHLSNGSQAPGTSIAPRPPVLRARVYRNCISETPADKNIIARLDTYYITYKTL